MEGVQAFILSMEKESQNKHEYGKTPKGYKKTNSAIKRFTLILTTSCYFIFISFAKLSVNIFFLMQSKDWLKIVEHKKDSKKFKTPLNFKILKLKAGLRVLFIQK